MQPATVCPTPEAWMNIQRWELSEADSETFALHLSQCISCSSKVEELMKDDAFALSLRSCLPLVGSKPEDPHVLSAIGRLARLSYEGLAHGAITVNPPELPQGQLGEYRLERELDRGGMGVVYEATDINSLRRAAVKVMLPRQCSEAGRQRFLREGKMLASIKSDHVVTIYRVAEEQGVPFLAMEFLEGATLEGWLSERDGSVTVPEILWIAKNVLTGLAALHKQGLVHRDLKPGNLWVEQSPPRVKILDFGLIKQLEADALKTPDGALLGTPYYMSPEQAKGDKVDSRSDLFSLGTILYRVIAGSSPFERTTLESTLAAVVNHHPPRLEGIPESVADFIASLLSKSPSGRPNNAAEALTELERIEDVLVQSATLPFEQPRLPRRRSAMTYAGLLALAVALVVGVIVIIKDRKGKTIAKIEINDPKAKVAKVAVIDPKSGKTTQVDPKKGKVQPPKNPDGGNPEKPDRPWSLREGVRFVVNANIMGYSAKASAVPHLYFDMIDKGTKGTILEVPANSNRCRVQFDDSKFDNVWISRDFVSQP